MIVATLSVTHGAAINAPATSAMITNAPKRIPRRTRSADQLNVATFETIRKATKPAHRATT